MTSGQRLVGWVIAKEPAFVPVLGMKNAKQLEDAFGALDKPLAPADVKALEEIVALRSIAGDRYATEPLRHLDSESWPCPRRRSEVNGGIFAPMAAKKTSPAVENFFADAPEDRRAALTAVRKVILDNLPKGYVETTDMGMVTYEVPLSVYPDTYNKKPLLYAAFASQKNFMALYLCSLYVSGVLTAEFKASFAKAGKRLDMGKSCVRFKKLEDLALDAVADAIRSTPMADYIAIAKAAHSKEAVAARKEARTKAAAKSVPKVAKKAKKKG